MENSTLGACPACGSSDYSEVWIDEDGEVVTERPDWADGESPGTGGSDGDSPAICNACGHEGTLQEFGESQEDDY